MGAPATPSGSHPSGHAAVGVDGASRFDPSRIAQALAALVDQDLEINGGKIIIRCASRADAIRRIIDARRALDAQPLPDTP